MKLLQRILLVGGVMLLLGACTSTEGEQALAKDVYDPNDADTVTCRTVVPTGSRIGTRVCRKNREWAEDGKRGRAYAEGIQRRGAIQRESG